MIEELKEHKSLLIALLVALLIAAVGITMLQKKSVDKNADGTPKKVEKNNDGSKNIVAKGMLSIEPTSGRFIYEVGETVGMLVRGSSDGQDAVGFDAAVRVNQSLLVFSKAESKLANFDTFHNANPDRVYVGGIRKLDSKTASIFDSAELTELTFKARKEGHARLDFIFKPGETTDSNIVLTSSKDGLGEVKGADIYVGKKVNLTTTSALILPSTNIKVTLKALTTESAQLDIALGEKSEPKKFTWGSGTLSKNVETSSGFAFQVEKGNANAVVVYYALEKTLN